MAEEGFKRKLTAILSADVVGYSRLMGEDEETTVQTLTTYRDIITNLIESQNGRVADAKGDNILAEFASVVDAVRCAVEVQRNLSEKNAELPDNRKMEFRIGINLGDIIDDQETIYGDGVNIAARLEGLAHPGGICISGTAYDHVKNKLDLGYEYLGEQQVKNIPDPVRVYRVLIEPEYAGKIIDEDRVKRGRLQPRVIVAAGVIVLVAGVLVIWNFYFRPPPIEPASVEKMAYPLPDKPSIAVLPFDNLSGDPDKDYIADGITDNIITALSFIPQMFVIARNSSFTYKGKPVKVQQVSEELGVQYVLEGSVLKSGEKVRITAQLIDALTGGHMWSERYDREIKDIFDMLDEITLAITVALQVELTDGEQARIWYGSTRNFEAWGHVVKGMGNLYKYGFGKEAIVKSRELFEKALELDPSYAYAVTMLAWTHYLDSRYGFTESRSKSFRSAAELANKSVTLDDNQPPIHLLLMHINLRQGKHDMAIAEGRKAVALGPNDAEAHIHFGQTLYRSGIFDEAVKMCEKALRLHPRTPMYYFGHMMNAYYWVGRYEESLAMAEQLINRGRKANIGRMAWWGYWGSARAKVKLDRVKEARDDVAESLRINPNYSLELDRRNTLYKPEIIKQEHDVMRKAEFPEYAPLPLPDKPSIAILPFDNLSADPEQEYFSDGMTDDLITDLSKISGLFVIARNSSFQYKGQSVDVKKVSRELGVRYILEGSVRKAGNKLRINAQLIDATTGGHLWAERYDREYKDIFALQDEVIQRIVFALTVNLTQKEKEQLARKYTDNLEAYEYYLHGEQSLHSFSVEGLAKARSMFQKAIDHDPKFAQAYAAHALASYYIWNYQLTESGLKMNEDRNQAYQFATKALDFDSSLPMAHSVLAAVNLAHNHFDEAIASADKAVALEPNNADSYVMRAYVLTNVGRHKEAQKEINTALRLNPNPPPHYYYRLSDVQFNLRQYTDAIKSIKKTGNTFPDHILSWNLAPSYAHLGHLDEARAELKKLVKVYHRFQLAYVGDPNLFHWKLEEDKKHWYEGFRKAGLQNLPWGYRRNMNDIVENMLSGEEIEGLAVGRTWSGFKPGNGAQWWVQFAEGGKLKPRGAWGTKTGTYWIEEFRICWEWEGPTKGKEGCGFVYPNPTGTAEKKNEYEWGVATGACPFTIAE
jgi:adenylate cyclase